MLNRQRVRLGKGLASAILISERTMQLRFRSARATLLSTALKLLLVLTGTGLMLALEGCSTQESSAVFAFNANGFPGWGLADVNGRLVRAPVANLHKLSAGHWVQTGLPPDGLTEWFDDNGKVSSQQPYKGIREKFESNPKSGKGKLWHIWRKDEIALVDDKGKIHTPWQSGGESWRATQHPDRIVWTEGNTEMVFGWDGHERLRANYDKERWISGPFPTRLLYWLCPPDAAQPCDLRDEAGTSLFQGHFNQLKEMESGKWLARSGNLWGVLDAKGQYLNNLRYLGRNFSPDVRSHGWRGGEAFWPIPFAEYRVDKINADALNAINNGNVPQPANFGFLHRDGTFYPLPKGYLNAYVNDYLLESCPNRWRIDSADKNGGSLIIDGQGRRIFDLGTDKLIPVNGRPGQLLRFPSSEKGDDKNKSVVDCDGKTLFADETVKGLEALGPGYIGYIEEQQFKRVWVGQDLRKHVLPKGSNILESDPEGQLLVVREGEHNRLFNVAQDQFVGMPFDHANAPAKGWLVFNRNGYYGLMDSKGTEVLPPTHYELMLWGKDRIWGRQPNAKGEVLRLHDASGKVLFERKDAYVSPVSDGDGQDEGSSIHSISEWDKSGNTVASVSKTYSTPSGPYFIQEWVRRDGAVALTAVQCPGSDPKAVLSEGDSMLIGKGSSQPIYENGHCELPDSIREALKI